jgi:hypothetical protein
MYDGNIAVAKEVIPSTLMTAVTGSGRCLGYFRALQPALIIDTDLRFGDTAPRIFFSG